MGSIVVVDMEVEWSGVAELVVDEWTHRADISVTDHVHNLG